MLAEDVQRISKLLSEEDYEMLAELDVSADSLHYVAAKLAQQILGKMPDWDGMGLLGCYSLYPLWNTDERCMEWHGSIAEDVCRSSYRYMITNKEFESDTFETVKEALLWIVSELYQAKIEGFDW